MDIGKICTYHSFLIEKEKSVYDAAVLMKKHGIRKLLIVEEQDQNYSPMGFLSSSDIATRVILHGIDAKKTEIQKILLKKTLFYATENQKIEEVLAIMADNRIRQMPIIDEGNKLMGMASIDNIILYLERKINCADLKFPITKSEEFECLNLVAKVIDAQVPEHFNYCEVRV